MSRFQEFDSDEFSEEDHEDFERAMVKAYEEAKPDLAGFLAHLDAMPRKRIIADRFMGPRSGECCAVAEFCRFKGIDHKEMLEAERESRLQRTEDEGATEAGYGWEGPTVAMGEQAGLPEYVAYDLGFLNDVQWDRVDTGHNRQRTETSQYSGRINTWTERIYRKMTPEERWLKLRNHVASKVGAPLLKSANA